MPKRFFTDSLSCAELKVRATNTVDRSVCLESVTIQVLIELFIFINIKSKMDMCLYYKSWRYATNLAKLKFICWEMISAREQPRIQFIYRQKMTGSEPTENGTWNTWKHGTVAPLRSQFELMFGNWKTDCSIRNLFVCWIWSMHFLFVYVALLRKALLGSYRWVESMAIDRWLLLVLLICWVADGR